MSNKVKSSIKHGVARVPLVMQMEMLECGAASLAMVMAYYGKWISLEQVRTDCDVSRDGSNALSILKAARSYGMVTNAWRMEPAMLKEEGTFPCIIHWSFNHFVVLDGFKGDKAVLNDPARGKVTVDWEEFDREFTGVCLMFEPGEDFVPSGHRKGILDYAGDKLKGARAAIIFVVLTTVITSLLGMIQPVFSRIFLDRLLNGKNPEWFNPFIIGLCAMTIIMIIASTISALYSIRLQGKMSASGETSYLWKVLRLPIHFFSQRLPGDIASRQDDNATISATLVNTFAPLAIDAVMMVFYLVVMFRYSPALTLIGVGATLINIIVSAIVTNKRMNITRVQLRDDGKLVNATVSGISMIETIKASGAEKGFFNKWAGYQASSNTQSVNYTRLNNFLGVVPSLVSSLANLAILGLGVVLVLNGQFEVGMVMAFQGFLTSFMQPANALIEAGQSMQEMTTQIERVDDVMNYPEDPVFNEISTEEEDYRKLSGNIEIRNLSFGYSKFSDPIIKDLSISIKTGQKIAFVGPSGCGKSTIAKLVSGLYQPWEGTIEFDGKKILEIDRKVFTGSIAVVDQDVTLFEDTISENIKMWDSTIEDFEVILAARDAGIHDDIMLKEGGYHHKLIEGGRDLSGGQRQRVEIARALAQDPTICILDEATSALDAKTENEVVNAISERGITCIVIAHRLSTIRDCDLIIVLKDGKEIERGTHEELIKSGGLYSELITNE